MNKRYDILLGLALLAAVATGYFFNQNRYFHVTTGEEVNKAVFNGFENKAKWQVEWHFNYEAGFTAGIGTLGLGLILFGVAGKNRRRVSRVS
ncbi:hypothetical protein [Rufibacter hautae]|uniref:Uncharacterized protein n=1 Tax=Rufibacter hautae TaxID=2595005 RepID=A0A5B6TPF9_9BACT|nr:hypothetical protein [Rufibacter hautae]KAA3438303.1 hypothetical protein FOA19_13690 [Rufibacter hautae]